MHYFFMKDEYRNLIDRTPPGMSPPLSPLCPQIYETSDGNYLIVGDVVDSEDAGLAERVNSDEMLIKVPRKLIDKMLI